VPWRRSSRTLWLNRTSQGFKSRLDGRGVSRRNHAGGGWWGDGSHFPPPSGARHPSGHTPGPGKHIGIESELGYTRWRWFTAGRGAYCNDEVSFCEAAPLVKHRFCPTLLSLPHLFLYAPSSRRGSSSFCSRFPRVTPGSPAHGGIRWAGGAIYRSASTAAKELSALTAPLIRTCQEFLDSSLHFSPRPPLRS
jgi:hypothetical protein